MRKLLSTTIAVSILTSLSITSAFADIAGNTLPSFNNGTNVDVTTNGSNAMNVQIQGGQGGVGIANWNTFNVGKDASVNFEFTAHNQTSLNKVSAAGGMSQIYGSLTNSGCAGCGYDATGKVILVNPNGVLFGDGANINLNSFTATTFDANYDKDTNKLSLTRKDGAGDIIVRDGANIYGDKNVTLAASNIKTYAGSKISTSTIPNVGGTDSYGKVKLVTADGVNFTFYNNGAVKEVSDVAASTDKMIIGLNGTIESGHIDIRNASENEGSEINLAGATLKATKAEIGNDGNIWLTANNKIVIDDKSSLETVNGGNIRLLAKNKVSVNDSELSSAGNVNIISVNGLSFKRYLEVAKKLDIKVAVITDNDKDFETNITNKYSEYKDDININIYSDDDNSRYTFEVCLFNDNKEFINTNSITKTEDKLKFMLNNKSESAYRILELLEKKSDDFKVPKYIKDAIEWIKD